MCGMRSSRDMGGSFLQVVATHRFCYDDDGLYSHIPYCNQFKRVVESKQIPMLKIDHFICKLLM